MALFNILRVINNWAILNQDGHQNTWTYLKKAMIRHCGHMKDSRSYIGALFGIRLRTSNFDSLDAFTSDVIAVFRVVRETLPQPDDPTVIAN